uniref:Uncharacterized protein n=1 Tax=Vitis vinifera TaxID=29760 RepID=A5BTZ3_VITVI|nr:hypothetical protein VITISV_009905 [Vitis vinifera]
MDQQAVTIDQFTATMASIQEALASLQTTVLEDTHTHKDRIEQRIRQLRVSDSPTAWDDLESILMANLSTKFRILDIEKYTGIGYPHIHLQIYNIVMRAHRLDESQMITLFPLSLSEVAQRCVHTPFVLIPDIDEVHTPYVDDVHTSDIQYVIRGGRVVRQQSPTTARPLEGATSHEEVRREDGEILRQLQSTQARISIWTLLASSSTCRNALIRALSQIRVETTTTLEGLIHMMTIGKATCIVFSNDDLPPEGSDHTRHQVSSVLLDNGLALNVCLLAIAIALGYAPLDFGPLDFGPSTQTVRAYDSTKREVLRIPTSFNLLLGRPWIHRAKVIPSSLHQKVKFIHDGQYGPSEFIVIPNHDVPFGLGFILTEADYRYMARLRKEMVRAQLTNTSFDYLVRPYSMSLANYFVRASELQTHSNGIIDGFSTVQETELQRLVHQLQLSDGAPGTSASALTVPLSPNCMSLMTLYVLDELASSFDLFGMSAIEVVEEIQIAPSLEFSKDAIVVKDLFKGPVGPVEGASDLMDPPLSFDVLLRFVSRSDDVKEEIQKQLSMGFLSMIEYSEWLVNVFHVPKKDDKVRVYVDDMIVKSRDKAYHLAALERFFERIRQFKLRLNPKKCTFEVTSGKLLGYMVSERGIEVDPNKIRDILDMSAPRTEKEIKDFLGRFQYISRFIARLTDICEPIFLLLRNSQPIILDDQCQRTFKMIKEYLLSPLVLVSPTPGRPLLLYLSVSNIVLRCILAQLDDSGKERAIYYLSKRMLDYETIYVMIERFCLALVWFTRKLRHYMTKYSVHLISYLDPLRYLFNRSALIGRLMRWLILLTEFNIHYVTQKSIRWSIVVDHLTSLPVSDGRIIDDDFPYEDTATVTSLSGWRMYFDGAADHSGYGIGVLFISPNGDHIPRFVRLAFSDRHLATNNIVEYKAYILGLDTTLELGIR